MFSDNKSLQSLTEYENGSGQFKIYKIKMVAFLMEMQGGYTKYHCLLDLWDKRADSVFFQQGLWTD